MLLRRQVEPLRQILLPRRRSHLVVIHRGVLVGEFAATRDPVVEKVDPGAHAIRRHSLRHALVNLGLHLPRLTVAVLGVDVVEVLGTIWFFLARWRALPLFELLKDLSIGVNNGYNRLAKAFTNQCL